MSIKTLFAALSAFVLLLIYKQVYIFSCFFPLSIALFVTLIITYSLAKMRLEQRACLAECYFEQNTFLRGLFKSPFLPLLFSFILALVVSIFLFVSLVFMGIFDLLILLLDLFVLVFCYHYLYKKLSTSIKERIVDRVVIALITWINLFVMAILYAVMQYYAPPPIDLSNTLEYNIAFYSNSVASECGFLNSLLKSVAEIKVLEWYGWEYLVQALPQDKLRFGSTVLFLLQGGLLYFALGRYFLEVIHFIHKQEKKDG